MSGKTEKQDSPMERFLTVASIGWVTSLVQEAEASQKRINEFLNQKPSIQNKTNNQTLIKGKIAFENVHLTYNDTKIEALKGITFDIEKGKTLAIIGKTCAMSIF